MQYKQQGIRQSVWGLPNSERKMQWILLSAKTVILLHWFLLSDDCQCELRVKNFRMNKNRLSYIHAGFDRFLKVVKFYQNLTLILYCHLHFYAPDFSA